MDLKSIDLLRSTKNKIYPFYRIDTLFSDIKHQSVEIVNDGGWHFSNLKNIEELEKLSPNKRIELRTEKFSNMGN